MNLHNLFLQIEIQSKVVDETEKKHIYRKNIFTTKTFTEGRYAMVNFKPESKKEEEVNGLSLLENLVREGARKMLMTALEQEVAEFIEKHKEIKHASGKRVVTRNGYMPERDFLLPVGNVKIKQPRVDDRKLENMKGFSRFSSMILPKFVRRAPCIDNLIPTLYLKGISSNDFPEALEAILGEGAKGLSPANIVRLKNCWEQEFEEWKKRDLTGKRYVYIWADGVYFNIRCQEPERSCILVIMGATQYGQKELIAIQSGYRESSLSWKEVLLDLKQRGLTIAPKLAVGDGALGFWKAMSEVFPETKRQRCWVHKTANILDKLPKKVQPLAKTLIHEMYMSPTKESAMESYKKFAELFDAKYPKAVECLTKDEEDLFNFYDFPAEHWIHIRTSNPIESTFATVRLRTFKTKGCCSAKATEVMAYKLVSEAEKTWRKLKCYAKL